MPVFPCSRVACQPQRWYVEALWSLVLFLGLGHNHTHVCRGTHTLVFCLFPLFTHLHAVLGIHTLVSVCGILPRWRLYATPERLYAQVLLPLALKYSLLLTPLPPTCAYA
ncbi:hypothetical protein RJT34_19693 [Clitoria ternatea]|uniref:Uncharacterized protein n=1 Tax=Clitoria ternatea TaxID=43366 RepID=A0AAN9IRN4_CLITE